MWWGPGFGWAGMIFGGLMMLLFWGGLIVLGFLAFRALTRSEGWQSRNAGASTDLPANNALAILKERYAKGEIDKEQYERIRSDLLA